MLRGLWRFISLSRFQEHKMMLKIDIEAEISIARFSLFRHMRKTR